MRRGKLARAQGFQLCPIIPLIDIIKNNKVHKGLQHLAAVGLVIHFALWRRSGERHPLEVLQHPSARLSLPPVRGTAGAVARSSAVSTRGASAFRAVRRADRLAPLRGTVPKRARRAPRVRSDAAGCKHKRPSNNTSYRSIYGVPGGLCSTPGGAPGAGGGFPVTGPPPSGSVRGRKWLKFAKRTQRKAACH